MKKITELKKIRKSIFEVLRSCDFDDISKSDLMEAHNLLLELIAKEEEKERWKT